MIIIIIYAIIALFIGAFIYGLSYKENDRYDETPFWLGVAGGVFWPVAILILFLIKPLYWVFKKGQKLQNNSKK